MLLAHCRSELVPAAVPAAVVVLPTPLPPIVHLTLPAWGLNEQRLRALAGEPWMARLETLVLTNGGMIGLLEENFDSCCLLLADCDGPYGPMLRRGGAIELSRP